MKVLNLSVSRADTNTSKRSNQKPAIFKGAVQTAATEGMEGLKHAKIKDALSILAQGLFVLTTASGLGGVYYKIHKTIQSAPKPVQIPSFELDKVPRVIKNTLFGFNNGVLNLDGRFFIRTAKNTDDAPKMVLEGNKHTVEAGKDKIRYVLDPRTSKESLIINETEIEDIAKASKSNPFNIFIQDDGSIKVWQKR